MPQRLKKQARPTLAQDVISAYQRTGSCHKVAEELGIGATTAHRILKAHGINRPRTGPQEAKRKLVDMDAVRAMHADGKTAGEIAMALQISNWLALQSLRRAGCVPLGRGTRKRVFTEDQKERMLGYAKAGVSQEAIGQMFGCGQSAVGHVLRGMGHGSRHHAKGERHGSWKGGITTNGDGYLLESVPPTDPLAGMRNAGGYVPQHRLVMARYLGRALYSHETVHHINGDRQDNRLENLQLRIGAHGAGIAMRCACCGSVNLVPVELKGVN